MANEQQPADHNTGGGVFAHLEDSTALAENLWPADLKAALDQIGEDRQAPKTTLQRAWLYFEYALATPEFEGDDALFDNGRQELAKIIDNSQIDPRHPTRLAADMLLLYEDAFRLRANLLPITDDVFDNLQQGLSNLMLAYLEVPELSQTEYGQLSELVAATYLLNTELFPYLASRREECNIYTDDNHDFYTVHPFAVARGERTRKAPLSIKFRHEQAPGVVLTLAIGHLARIAALNVPIYEDARNMDERQALRLAADIMICHTTGESLSQEDEAFMNGLAYNLRTLVLDYATGSNLPDYASNAEAIKAQIARVQTRSHQ